MLPVSVCMIAKNEDNHIEECLKRLRPCRFEIIVVDTGSVDRTVEIAHKYADKVFHFAWCDDFSSARNFSVQQAANDWVLTIDCDEYLENVNLAELEDSLARNRGAVGMIKRNNPYTVQGARSIMSERIGRLFNRNFCHYEGTVHEQVRTLQGKEPEQFPIPLTFYHEGYVEESDKRMRATRNLEMLLHDLVLKGPSPYMYFQLGQNYLSLNDLEKAAHYYKLGLELSSDLASDFSLNMMEAYGYCLMNLAKYDTAMALKEHYDRFSDRADFVYLMGMLHMKKGETDQAIEEFEKATQLSAYSRTGVNSYRAYFQMADIYESRGEFEKARTYYKKCGDFEPAIRRLKELSAQSAS
ncbi:MAG: glycosyltransferase [Bacteroidales bacterium]|nr:glycosyltransferase [Bacteroidales bacterium]MCM1414880.1 glycosyltransferase [bacterium]MCM1424069.1 glycosyltransferase [bacterium]